MGDCFAPLGPPLLPWDLMVQTHKQTDTHTNGHDDSQTNSAQWGRVGENPEMLVRIYANFEKLWLLSQIHGRNIVSWLKWILKNLEEDRAGLKHLYGSKEWRKAKRWMDRKKKAKNWLGSSQKSYIFVPPTQGSELRRLLQKKEIQMRPGGREDWPIKIVETARKSIECCLVTTDPFHGNQCDM